MSTLRSARYDKKVEGGYYCNAPNCKTRYINMYRDPCWRPQKTYGRPAARMGLSPTRRRR